MTNKDNMRQMLGMDRRGRECACVLPDRNSPCRNRHACCNGRDGCGMGSCNARGMKGDGACGCSGGEKRETDRCMRKLQQLDFAIQEIVLYLDSYPGCRRALDRYHRLLCERKRVAAECAELTGPMTAWQNENAQAWDWVKNPWPWQSDFPGNKNI